MNYLSLGVIIDKDKWDDSLEFLEKYRVIPTVDYEILGVVALNLYTMQIEDIGLTNLTYKDKYIRLDNFTWQTIEIDKIHGKFIVKRLATIYEYSELSYTRVSCVFDKDLSVLMLSEGNFIQVPLWDGLIARISFEPTKFEIKYSTHYAEGETSDDDYTPIYSISDNRTISRMETIHGAYKFIFEPINQMYVYGDMLIIDKSYNSSSLIVPEGVKHIFIVKVPDSLECIVLNTSYENFMLYDFIECNGCLLRQFYISKNATKAQAVELIKFIQQLKRINGDTALHKGWFNEIYGINAFWDSMYDSTHTNEVKEMLDGIEITVY